MARRRRPEATESERAGALDWLFRARRAAILARWRERAAACLGAATDDEELAEALDRMIARVREPSGASIGTVAAPPGVTPATAPDAVHAYDALRDVLLEAAVESGVSLDLSAIRTINAAIGGEAAAAVGAICAGRDAATAAREAAAREADLLRGTADLIDLGDALVTVDRDWRITQRRRYPLPGALAKAWGRKSKALYLKYPRFLRLGIRCHIDDVLWIDLSLD